MLFHQTHRVMRNLNSIVLLFSSILAISCCELTGTCDDPNEPTTEVGDTLWIHETPVIDSMVISTSLALGQNGDVYYVVNGTSQKPAGARVIALDADNGSVKWMTQGMDHTTGVSSQIVVGDDNTIYVIGFHTLYAFDPTNGSTKWKWEVPETLPNPDNPQSQIFTKGQIGALALTDNGDLILGSIGSGSYRRGLYGVDKNGNKTFHNLNAVGPGIHSGIYIGKNNTAFYYTDLDWQGNNLVAVDAATGNIKWSIDISRSGTGENNIVIKDDGNLFCAFKTINGTQVVHHIVNASDGSILWSGSSLSTTLRKWIGPDGTLYENQGPHKVDPATGDRTLVVNSTLGAISDNNRLVTAFTDADNIRKLGVFYPDGLLDYTTYMNGLDGNTMVISDDKVIFGIVNLHPVSYLPTQICAIQGNGRLADNGWPRYHHDNRNTNNIDKR